LYKRAKSDLRLIAAGVIVNESLKRLWRPSLISWFPSSVHVCKSGVPTKWDKSNSIPPSKSYQNTFNL